LFGDIVSCIPVIQTNMWSIYDFRIVHNSITVILL